MASKCKASGEFREYLDIIAECIKNTGNINECENQINAAVRKFGMSYLDKGVDRIVYGIGDCVVKFARHSAGRDANLYEAIHYKELPNDIKDFFIPVTDHHPEFYWNMSPKAIVLPHLSYEEAEDISYQILRELNRRGYDCIDLHPHNVGKIDDKPVIVNYGFGVRCPTKVEEKIHEAITKKYSQFLRQANP